ncbi:mycothiol conjugate amidase Mca [Iamia sp. SCSIO 61187]|uniref:mycothiol conjugate amidase Mca n=1 Tax=Iamia sp. SCSIO 61187 TaxID=2722752 RepID=UPI001C62C252|nr:mycothiol conjugate amidase Mca [Iamia sp. SCSIO 61187]QYG92042.1 mycothiol conjugate amidase Mca [Iamia sp. SCSIO 61187]
MSSPRRCLLSVHAHPDDESSKGAGTVHRYHEAGVRTVLVCCTGGEAGDILNPALDTPEVRDRIDEVRMEELAAATAIIGYDEVVMLGYRDSGMPDSPDNADPRCFARAPLDEAVGRLVAIIRRERPQVVLTYGDDQSGYPHPDHLKVHDVTMAALPAAADPDAYPEAGAPWQVAKVYWSVWSRRRLEATHEAFLAHGLESPYSEEWFARESQDHRITTSIDVDGLYAVKSAALRAHATQIDPTSPFWFGLPEEVAETIHPYEDYIRAVSTVDAPLPETDLFAGLD